MIIYNEEEGSMMESDSRFGSNELSTKPSNPASLDIHNVTKVFIDACSPLDTCRVKHIHIQTNGGAYFSITLFSDHKSPNKTIPTKIACHDVKMRDTLREAIDAENKSQGEFMGPKGGGQHA